MALINVDAVFTELKRYMKTCPVGGGLEIMSYKRNRTVAVIKKDGGSFTLKENGYQTQEFEVSSEDVAKKLKTIIKREFPRSRKLRLFKFARVEQLHRTHQII